MPLHPGGGARVRLNDLNPYSLDANGWCEPSFSKANAYEREGPPPDARATHVVLQSEGRRQAKDAQGALEAFARDAFLARLTQGELATLAGVFGRLIDSARGDAET